MSAVICLVTCINKLLQMDLTDSALSSQNTSPSQDPAEFHRLAKEVSSQASVLASHQRQLVKLTSLTEELVRSVQALTPQMAAANQAPVPTVPVPPLPVVSTTSNNPRLSLPEKN